MNNRKSQQSDRPDSGMEGGFINPLVASTEQAARAVGPAVKWATCTNMELVSLAGRRTRAYLELPSTVAQCRGPQDLLALQSRFWQAAFKDYADCTQRIAAVLTPWNGDESEERTDGGRERDTLTFPDVFNLSAWTLPDTDSDRRTAQGRAA